MDGFRLVGGDVLQKLLRIWKSDKKNTSNWSCWCWKISNAIIDAKCDRQEKTTWRLLIWRQKKSTKIYMHLLFHGKTTLIGSCIFLFHFHVLLAEKPLNFACLPSHQNVATQGMFSSFGSKRLIFVMFPSSAERACARNAEPANVSDILSRDILLRLVISLYGNMKERLAK